MTYGGGTIKLDIGSKTNFPTDIVNNPLPYSKELIAETIGYCNNIITNHVVFPTGVAVSEWRTGSKDHNANTMILHNQWRKGWITLCGWYHDIYTTDALIPLYAKFPNDVLPKGTGNCYYNNKNHAYWLVTPKAYKYHIELCKNRSYSSWWFVYDFGTYYPTWKKYVPKGVY